MEVFGTYLRNITDHLTNRGSWIRDRGMINSNNNIWEGEARNEKQVVESKLYIAL